MSLVFSVVDRELLSEDFKRLPLFGLRIDKIKLGYKALARAENSLTYWGDKSVQKKMLKEATDDFYANIPLAYGTEEHRPQFSSKEIIRQKQALLDFIMKNSTSRTQDREYVAPFTTIRNQLLLENISALLKYVVTNEMIGALNKQEIYRGFDALSLAEKLVLNGKHSGREMDEATKTFYDCIPHKLGLRGRDLLNKRQTIKEKFDLVCDLDNAMLMFHDFQSSKERESLAAGGDHETECDRLYRSLNIKLDPLDHDSATFKMIETYVRNSHAHHYTDFYVRLVDVFAVEKDLPFVDGPNKWLLFHGSRLSNWAGVLSQGLRICPPEAPCSGYMFGKGIYMTDVFSKAALHCFARQSRPYGLVGLMEAVLGDQHKVRDSDCYLHETLPPGKLSTFGMGRNAPDPSQTLVWENMSVPLGHLIPVNRHASLNYNEFIVYQPTHVRLKFLMKVHFNFNC